jgi:hypothetical protein
MIITPNGSEPLQTFDVPYQCGAMSLDETLDVMTGVNHLFALTKDLVKLKAAVGALYPDLTKPSDVIIPLSRSHEFDAGLQLVGNLQQQGRPYLSLPGTTYRTNKTIAAAGWAMIDKYTNKHRIPVTERFHAKCARVQKENAGEFGDYVLEFFLHNLHLLQHPNNN